jgi:hypothetical protein|tara:strand:- start:425 stop:889 length:465 start_codon:yes stop_codon:yes gene_type:complete
MPSFRYLLNKYAELIFKDAMANKSYAMSILHISKVFSNIPYGLWLFRIGEISKSLNLLNKVYLNISVVKISIDRSDKIIAKLNQSKFEMLNPIGLHWNSFNNKILFACHSNGYFQPNGYAYRTKEISPRLIAGNIPNSPMLYILSSIFDRLNLL